MTDSVFDIKDKIVVVTGGMGQLGQQFIKILLDNCARVAALDLLVGKVPLNEQLKKYEKEDKLLLIQADVTSRKSLEHALIKIQNKWKKSPYGLINNAQNSNSDLGNIA